MSACQSAANVTVVDFDSVAGIGVVDHQFSGPGVDFNGTATALSGYEWLDFPQYSGDIVVYETLGGGGTMRVNTAGLPWMMAGGYVTANENVTLTAYDSFSFVLGTVSTSWADDVGSGKGWIPNMSLSVSVANIAYAEFTDSGNTYTVEDFAFQPIPAPRAVLLGSIGVGLIGWLRRCRTL
jgi:hypothetical protein